MDDQGTARDQGDGTTTNKGYSRGGAVFHRWLGVVILAVCGGLAGWAVLSLRFPLPEWLGSNWAVLVTGRLGFMVSVVFWTVVFSIGSLRTAFSWRNRRRDYPSCAVAVRLVALFGTAYALRLWWRESIPGILDFGDYAGCWALAGAACPVFLPFLALLLGYSLLDGWDWFSGMSRRRNPSGAQPFVPDPGLPDDLQWILDEKPAEDLDKDDRFQRGALVRRLVRVLQETNERGTSKSIGLVGDYGSGKTTIVRFVERTVKKQAPNILFVRVPGWGVADRGLTGFVLECAVDALEAHGVDCLAIRGLPQQYLAAVDMANEKAGKLAQAFCGAPSPEAALRKLEPILTALDLRLVLCVEDVERGASQDALQDLAGMLDRFRSIDRVSFLIEANQNSSTRLDLFRVCDHVEPVPRMRAEDTWNLLRALRQACLECARKRDDILPAEEALDHRHTPPVRAEDAFWPEWFKVGSLFAIVPQYALMRKLAQAVGTPRVFKHGLRRVWLDWKQLHGEVDLRELILLNVLREVAPEAFQFVVDNIGSLRGISGGEDDEQQKGTRKELADRWDRLATSPETDWDPEAVYTILAALDLSFRKRNPELTPRTGACQSVHQIGTDYLQRIMAGEVDDSAGARDQDVLRELAAWGNGESREPPEKMLEVEGYAEKVEQFQGCLGGDDHKLRLCGEYLEYVFDRERAKAGRESQGFETIRRIVSSGPWMAEQIHRAFGFSVGMVHALYKTDQRTSDGLTTVCRQVAMELSEEIAKNPGRFANALDQDRPYALYGLFRDPPCFSSREPAQRAIMNVVSAAELYPASVVPHLAHLLIRDLRTIAGEVTDAEHRSHLFDEDYAMPLISTPSDRQRLVKLFLDYAASADAKPEIVEYIRAVENDLRRFAEEEPPPPSADDAADAPPPTHDEDAPGEGHPDELDTPTDTADDEQDSGETP